MTIDNTLSDCYVKTVPGLYSISRLDDESYVCHSGSQAGVSCAFELSSPTRTKILPYSYLMCIDLMGDYLLTLRYSFADVEISLGREFAGRGQFLDDLANFRVARVRESRQVKIRILTEPASEKTDIY
jgi:hypothetical protein